jgi:Zn-dependent protease with chaperone function
MAAISAIRIALTVAPLVTVLGVAAPLTSVQAEPWPVITRAAPTTTQAASRDEGPVPVPEPDEKALRYYRSGNVLWVVSTIWGFLVPALILFTGLSARLRSWAQQLGRRWVPTFALYVAAFSIVGFVLELPLAYYAEFVRQHAYGLSDQTAAKWWTDAFKGLGVGILGSVLTLWIPYLLIRLSPRRWWLYSGLATVPVLALILLINPIWIEPLFNKFGPMKDKALEAQILDVAGRAGISGARVFEVEKSVDTKTVNAYVVGLGRTKRIVLWDTLLAKLEPRETLFVMGHEMGHYVLGHVLRMLALLSAVVLLGLAVVHLSASRLIQRFRTRFGFDRLDDIASLPLLLLLVSLTTFVLTPLVLAFIRSNEHEADRFGLEITRDNHACGTSFVKLQKENLDNPRPGVLFKLWRSSHPPLGNRIEFCNAYRPWERGEGLRYGDRFVGP